MIGITKFLWDADFSGDRYRFHSSGTSNTSGAGAHGPVVVWNCTQTCNLKCIHCYANAEQRAYHNELTTSEAELMIEDLAKFKVPVLLISGGEPLMRPDIFHLIHKATQLGIRCTLSTNGTLIDKATAQRIKDADVGYVGISLDGIGTSHDTFRGVKDSFWAALEGIRNCMSVQQKVGLRFTISRQTRSQLPDIFRLIEMEDIKRVCFYHLVFSGRGKQLTEGALSAQESRETLDYILQKSLQLGPEVEILTVDNHADSIYTYLQSLKQYPDKSNRIWELMHLNGGNRSGIAIGCIGSQGTVHPDQFSQNHILGSLRDRPFSKIWTQTEKGLIHSLRNRSEHLQGRCAKCKWLKVCNGNFRARAEAATGNYWASDPGCYLTDSEIGLMEEPL